MTADELENVRRIASGFGTGFAVMSDDAARALCRGFLFLHDQHLAEPTTEQCAICGRDDDCACFTPPDPAECKDCGHPGYDCRCPSDLAEAP